MEGIIDEYALNIFTDGSSYSHPRRWWTWIVFVTVNKTSGQEESENIECNKSYVWWKIGQMELQACILALKEVLERDINDYSKIIIYTDSSYVVDNYNRAVFQWSKNGRKSFAGVPVSNPQLWKDLIKLIQKIRNKNQKKVEIKWVKWHKKNEYNKTADKLAKSVAKNGIKKILSIDNVRKKKFPESKTVVWSVDMLWQRITIYIVSDEYLKLSRMYKYRYQVLSKSSSFYKKTDFISSKMLLSAGHTYSVRFNDDQKNPQIIKKYREIENKKKEEKSE